MGSGILRRIQVAIAGKKTYLVAVAALIGAAVAWSEGAISNFDALVALYAAIQAICIRAGVAKAATSDGVVRVVDAMQSTKASEDAYEIEAKAHARLMNVQATRTEQEAPESAWVQKTRAEARLIAAEAEEKERGTRASYPNKD